jgi:branched-chain amino acid transport system permease protein
MYAVTLIAAGIANGSIYALVALGLALIYRTQDVVNFAHGELFMAGAFIGLTAYGTLGLPYIVAFLAAVLGGALLGLLVELGAIRPIANHPHVTLAMATVGLSAAMKGAVRLIYGSDIFTLPPIATRSIDIAGLVLAPQGLLNTAVAALIAVALLVLFRASSVGKQMRATQQNTIGARVIGVNTGRIYALTWGLAAAIGAAAGFLAAPVTLVYPDMGSGLLLKGFAAAVLGGFGSAPGAIAGGLLIGVAEMLVGGFVSTEVIDVSSYVLIMVVMLVRPAGLFGSVASSRV